jgi:hypothetical protein
LPGSVDMITFRGNVEHFLGLHLSNEHVVRFQKKGVYALHEMIKEFLDGGPIPHSRNDAAEEIRPFYDLLTAEEKRVLRFILPLHRSPTNLNVGQLTALENIQQKTGFVGRNYATGSYELNPKTIEGLKILLPADAGLYGKIICREISLVPDDQFYDCFLILSVRLMSDGEPTKAGRWQFDLYWEGNEYVSVRHSVDGYYVSYPESHADDPAMRLEPKPLIEFPGDEEITTVSPRTGWLRFKVGAFPPEAVDKQWQRLRKEVICKLQAFDSRDHPHVIYEGSVDALSGCGKIERPTKMAVPRPTVAIHYDENDPLYRQNTTHPRSGIGYQTCMIGVTSSVGGNAIVFVPKVKDYRGNWWPNLFLKPAAHQGEHLEAGYPGYWFVLHWNTHTKAIKLLRVGNEECLLSSPATFEIVARCAGAEKRVIARADILESEQEETDASGKLAKITTYHLQFRVDDI